MFDNATRWAVAILLFVDPKVEDVAGSPEDDLEGAKHFLLFSGSSALLVFDKAQHHTSFIGATTPVPFRFANSDGGWKTLQLPVSHGT